MFGESDPIEGVCPFKVTGEQKYLQPKRIVLQLTFNRNFNNVGAEAWQESTDHRYTKPVRARTQTSQSSTGVVLCIIK